MSRPFYKIFYIFILYITLLGSHMRNIIGWLLENSDDWSAVFSRLQEIRS